MKKKIINLLKKLWAFADGNKTIFLQMVWLAIEVGLIPITGPWLSFVRGFLAILTGGAIWDHQKKGMFTTKKIKTE